MALTTGAVLEGARASQTNAAQSDLPTCGVARDFKVPPAALAGFSPPLVDLHGSQYASAFLSDAQEQQTEYAVWAANSSQVALVPLTTTDANTKGVLVGTGAIPQGSLTVGSHTDGSDYLLVYDEAGRAVASILSVLYRRGPSSYYLLVATGTTAPVLALEDDDGNPIAVTTVPNAFAATDADAGLARLSSGALTALGGGASQARGDAVLSSYLVLANQTFWWSRNDAQTTRFTFDYKTQKWAPIKGSSVLDVTVVQADSTLVTLTPAPRDFSLGDYLPGAGADQYAMLRVGSAPSALSSDPVAYMATPGPGQFSGVLVVPDEDVAGFAFTGGDATLAGVVGLSTGEVSLNPLWVTAHVGLHLWYSAYSFTETNSGEVAPLRGSNLSPRFIAPIPGPAEVAFIRIGSRRYLTAIMVRNDADLLAAAAPLDSQVLVSLSTGRLRFSATLPNKADPASPDFDPAYLGESIFYDGVACCGLPQPLRQPAVACDAAGVPIPDVSAVDDLYLPIADPFANNGLGTSGISHVPDQTGSVPALGVPPVRAGGDALSDPNIGLVRRVSPQIGAYPLGDTAVYWYGQAIPTTKAVPYQAALPSFSWQVDADVANVTEQAVSGALSQVLINGDTQAGIQGPLYFLNALLTPARYTTTATLVSRIRNVFTVSGSQTEALRIRINADSFVWSSALLTPVTTTYTAEQMAASLLLSPRIGDNVPLGTLFPNAVRTDRGYLILEASSYVGIGFGTSLDLSGPRVTGFLPGWQATAGLANWYNDSGLSFGVGRSPLNLARTSPAPDYIDRASTIDQVLTQSVSALPYQRFDYSPLRDVAGYGDDVFFRRIAVVKGQPVTQDLRQFVDILYDLTYTRFGWLDQTSVEASVLAPLSTLPLGNTSVIPQTMLGAEPNPTGGLAVATGNGPFQVLTQGTDYLLPGDGQAGSAILIESIGQEITQGYKGQWTVDTTTFTDSQADFITAGVSAGDLLRVYPQGAASETYTVVSVASATSLVVSPAFVTGTSGLDTTWQLFAGQPVSDFDRAVIADFVYNSFNPLPSQSISVLVWSPLGQIATGMVADVAMATKNGRAISLRFGTQGPSAALTKLTQSKLGTLANGLFLPSVSTVRYTTASFSVLVGDTLYSHGGLDPLDPVVAFSLNPPGVEYLIATGELKFNSTLLTGYAGAQVYFVETFLPPASLAAGQAEYTEQGTLNLSQADVDAYPNTLVFLTEALTMGVDMLVNPMVGSFYLSQPLQAYQLVQALYWTAGPSGELAVDTDGNPIATSEFLPFYKQLEGASRVTSTVYAFDPPDANGFVRTVKQDTTPSVYVGATLQNYGQEPTAFFDLTQHTITLASPVVDTTEVLISYAVLEAFGGERTFTVTSGPIFQPPFFLPAGVSSFKLAGNRDDLIAGMMLRLGSATFYIQSVVYNVGESAVPDINAPYLAYPDAQGITTVTIYPPTAVEVGARSPSQQALTLVTATPVTDEVNGVTTAGPAGLWLGVANPFARVSAGSTSITFEGPVEFVSPMAGMPTTLVAGTILELAGQPYTVAKTELSSDGTQSIVSVTAPFPNAFSYSGTLVRASARPVYPNGARDFLPVGPSVAGQPVELVRFRTGEPGVLLTPNLEWSHNPLDGSVRLLAATSGLLAGERLVMRWTAQRVLAPAMVNGIAQVPRYTATYRYLTTPSEDNGLLGSTVQARYTFRYPDAFYCRALPLLAYLAEFAQSLAGQTQAATGAPQGPLLTSVTPTLAGNGQQSLLSQRVGLENNDRAARTYLSFYNDTIVAFEQVLEAITGDIVGDRDGKFRFGTYTSAFLPGPGLTDPITGSLTTRNVYSEVWNARSGAYLPLLTRDALVQPTGFSLVDGQLVGNTPSSRQLSFYLRAQNGLIRNDIDDVVLVGSRGTGTRLTGSYERLADPNFFSRLFPEAAQGIFVTLPGLDADVPAGIRGEYSFANFDKLLTEGVRSTFLDQIGQVTSPVLGPIKNITSITMEIRTPRGWVYGYYPKGIPAGSLFGAQPAITQPCILVAVVPLSDLTIDPATGFPDATQFVSQSGSVPDLTTGNTDLLLPYWDSPTLGMFSQPMQLIGGTSEGKVLALTSQETFLNGDLGGLYVKDVLYGCVVRFANVDQDLLTSPDEIEAVGLGLYAPEQGDTLAVRVRPDPDSTSLYQTLVHKDNFDAYVNFTTGQIKDLTAPFFPFQDPMFPLEFVQAQVSFTNTETEPVAFPALTGAPLLDNGDYSFPFVRVQNTELDRFDALTDAMASVMTARGPMPSQNYVYPDEILLADGNIKIAALATLPPATLLTAADLTPPATIGTGPVSPFDLLLVQTTTGDPTLPASALGFQTVASFTQPDATTRVDVPRFPSQTRKGSELEYALENYMVVVSGAGRLELAEDQTGAGPNGQLNKWVTLLDLSAMSALSGGILDSGWPAGVGVPGTGGLNTFLAADASNEVRIRAFTLTSETQAGVPYDAGDLVEEFVVTQTGMQALVAGTTVAGTTQFGWNNNNRLVRFIPTANGGAGTVLSLSALPAPNRFGTINNPSANLWETNSLFYFSISLYGYSDAAYIDTDRLTFKDVLDLRHATQRGTTETNGGWDVQTKLLVERVRARNHLNVAQWISLKYLNGKTGNEPSAFGCPFTFLPRQVGGTIGTFTPATGLATGDEVGALTVMAWEGVKPTGSGAILTANMIGSRVSTVSVIDGGAGYIGGYIDLVFDAAPPGGRTATAVATVVAGVITAVTVKLAGFGYVGAPTITVEHFAGNQPVPATLDVQASVIPSSPDDQVGTICQGTGLLGLEPFVALRPILRESLIASGSLASVQPGDIVTVTKDATNVAFEATELAGTYLVRHTIEPSVAGGPQRDLNLTTTVGSGSGWAAIATPTVRAWDEANLTLTLTDLGRFGGIEIVSATENVAQTTLTTATAHGLTVGEPLQIGGATTVPTINGSWTVVAVPSETTVTITAPVGLGGFSYGGRILDSSKPSTPHLWQGVADYGAFPNPTTWNGAYGPGYPRVYAITKLDGVDTEVVSIEYSDTGSDPNNNLLGLRTGTALSETGLAITDAEFFAALRAGQLVSGMVYFPIQLAVDGVDRNVQAYRTGAVNGFRHIRVQNTSSANITNFPLADLAFVFPYGAYTPPVVAEVGIGVCVNRDSDRFILDRDSAVYPSVPALLDLMGVANNQGAILTGLGRPHALAGASCLVTGDALITSDVANLNTAQVVAGIYLEPSFPTSANPVVGGPWVGQIASVASTNPAEVTFDPTYQVGELRQGNQIAICNTADPALNATWTVLDYNSGTATFTIAYDNSLNPPLGPGGDVYGTDQSRLVDADTTPVLLQTIGVRNPGFQQRVSYSVRRIRRFHDANNDVNANFLPLRYAYETRRGIITAYSASTKQTATITAASFSFPVTDADYANGLTYTGTQLGTFTDTNVNVQPGDLFRVIDPSLPPSQRVLETRDILAVNGDSSLTLAAPELTTVVPGTTQFEIWLRNAVVPHQQSADQLLDLLTQDTLIDRIVNRTAPLDPDYLKGGFVQVDYGPSRIAQYDTHVNKLQDDYMTDVLAQDYTDFGVQLGDIVLVDPQGAVGNHGAGALNLEFGLRPFGDVSIAERVAAYIAGKPAPLDDNRGFYRITKISPTTLTVDGTTAFASGTKTPVTFPKTNVNKATYGYAVYPTVHDSAVAPVVLGSNPEGQAALRPTSLPGLMTDGTPASSSDTYLETEYSIRPFAYRVIRPSPLLSREAVDLILTMRERMLSLIEQFKTAMSGRLGGDYYAFQKNGYGRDLGLPTLPSTGTGVFRNAVIDDLVGRLNTVPFTNDADCLSVLDRRFWILDERLDNLTTDGTGYGTKLAVPPEVPYTGYSVSPSASVRPVLPDRIGIVLDSRDRLRDLRFSWITYRVNRLTGSLPAIARFDAQYARARAQQLTTMRQRQGAQ